MSPHLRGDNVRGMTPQKNIRIDLSEINGLEITCKCGAAIVLPALKENGNLYQPLVALQCSVCDRPLWQGQNDEKFVATANFIRAVGLWKRQQQLTAETRPSFSLSITVPNNPA